MATSVAFGSWPSSISAASLVEGAKGVGEVVVDGDDVWWSESRPEERGRNAIMRLRAGQTKEVSPAPSNVRTMVHEYGGGAWWAQDRVLWYSDIGDGGEHRLWRLDETTVEPLALTPTPGSPGALRYADGRPTPDSAWFVCVQETHGPDASPTNEIVAIAGDGSHDVRVLVAGPDFVSSPRLDPSGTRLCWLQWNHPDMPWDTTALWVADFADGSISNARLIARVDNVAIVQPDWGPDGCLWAVSDQTEWWNLYRWPDLDSGIAPELVIGGDFEIGTPPWVFGMARYALTTAGPIAAHTANATDTLVHPASHAELADYSVITQVRPKGDGVVFVGATHGRESEIVEWHPGVGVTVLRAGRTLPHDGGYFAPPEHITFPTSDGEVAHALYYAPANPEHTGQEGELPPLLVKAHGGPTAAARPQLQLSHRYWTSRGIGVVDVDYRGSIGYGRTYRHALRARWGLADVADCVGAVEFLVARGEADPERVAIAGGSAGGFTVLAALEESDAFGAGASRYGVADLSVLATDTHKFESRYLDRLIGPWPEAEAIYTERSPINHTAKLSCPMILLQGGEDKVVPPNQAALMMEALDAQGLPYAYVHFAEEGHGFRQADNIVTAIESELSFFGQIFGFEPADELPALTIENL